MKKEKKNNKIKEHLKACDATKMTAGPFCLPGYI